MSNKERAGEKSIRLRTLLGVMLIIAGASLALFPYLQNYYYQQMQAEKAEGKLPEIQLEEDNLEERASPYIYSDEHKKTTKEKRHDPEKYPDSLEPDEGVLKIPRLDLKIKVSYGVELPDLEDGPGFYPESEYPARGNISIAGHRTTYGAPFRHLDDLEDGDEIYLYYNDKIYTYHVEKVFETHSRDWSVIDPTETPALTLTTCHPPGWNTERLIVRAYLDKN